MLREDLLELDGRAPDLPVRELGPLAERPEGVQPLLGFDGVRLDRALQVAAADVDLVLVDLHLDPAAEDRIINRLSLISRL